MLVFSMINLSFDNIYISEDLLIFSPLSRFLLEIYLIELV